MEHTKLLFEPVRLENGLCVYFEDRSTAVAGGRYQAVLSISIPMEVAQVCRRESDDSSGACDRYVRALGHTLVYRQDKVRNFIDGARLHENLREMKEEFLTTSFPYISRPGFALRFIESCFSKEEEKKSWQEAYMKALDSPEHD